MATCVQLYTGVDMPVMGLGTWKVTGKGAGTALARSRSGWVRARSAPQRSGVGRERGRLGWVTRPARAVPAMGVTSPPPCPPGMPPRMLCPRGGLRRRSSSAAFEAAFPAVPSVPAVPLLWSGRGDPWVSSAGERGGSVPPVAARDARIHPSILHPLLSRQAPRSPLPAPSRATALSISLLLPC